MKSKRMVKILLDFPSKYMYEPNIQNIYNRWSMEENRQKYIIEAKKKKKERKQNKQKMSVYLNGKGGSDFGYTHI